MDNDILKQKQSTNEISGRLTKCKRTNERKLDYQIRETYAIYQESSGYHMERLLSLGSLRLPYTKGEWIMNIETLLQDCYWLERTIKEIEKQQKENG
jgi:hypothetical protein